MTEEDLLLITADHGCDPAFKVTDHIREYVPLLIYGNGVIPGTDYGTKDGFYFAGETVEKFLLS